MWIEIKYFLKDVKAIGEVRVVLVDRVTVRIDVIVLDFKHDFFEADQVVQLS